MVQENRLSPTENRAPMIRDRSQEQRTLDGFEMPFHVTLNPDNRWVKLSWPMGAPIPLPPWLMHRYWAIEHLCDRHWQMNRTRTRRCDDCIVSLSQPDVRPIGLGCQVAVRAFLAASTIIQQLIICTVSAPIHRKNIASRGALIN